MTDLENDILDIINDATNSCYVGKLKVLIEPVNETGCNTCSIGGDEEMIYSLLLYLNQEQAPMVLSIQGNEEAFRNFIREEMKTRKMQKVHRYRLIKLDGLPCNE